MGSEVCVFGWHHDSNKGDAAIVRGTMATVSRIAGPVHFHVLAGMRAGNPSLKDLLRFPLPQGCSASVLPSVNLVDPDDSGVSRILRGAVSLVLLAVLIACCRWRWVAGSHPTVRALSSCAALIGKGGHYLYARPGVAGALGLYLTLAPLLLALRLGRPCVILGVTLGPFPTRLSRAIARFALGRCAHVTVRDEASLTELHELLPDQAFCSLGPDPAFGLAAPPAPLPDEPSLFFNIRGRDPAGDGAESSWTTALEMVLTGVRRRLPQVELRSLVTAAGTDPDWRPDRSSEDDRAATLELLRRISGDDPSASPTGVEGAESISPDETVRRISETHGGIGVRLHSGVLSILAGRPCIILDYHGTKAQTFEMLGLGDWVTTARALRQPDELDRVVGLLCSFVTEPERHSGRASSARDQAVARLRTDPGVAALARVLSTPDRRSP